MNSGLLLMMWIVIRYELCCMIVLSFVFVRLSSLKGLLGIRRALCLAVRVACFIR